MRKKKIFFCQKKLFAFNDFYNRSIDQISASQFRGEPAKENYQFLNRNTEIAPSLLLW